MALRAQQRRHWAQSGDDRLVGCREPDVAPAQGPSCRFGRQRRKRPCCVSKDARPGSDHSSDRDGSRDPRARNAFIRHVLEESSKACAGSSPAPSASPSAPQASHVRRLAGGHVASEPCDATACRLPSDLSPRATGRYLNTAHRLRLPSTRSEIARWGASGHCCHGRQQLRRPRERERGETTLGPLRPLPHPPPLPLTPPRFSDIFGRPSDHGRTTGDCAKRAPPRRGPLWAPLVCMVAVA